MWEVPPGAPAAKLLRDFDPEVNALYRFVALRDVTKRLAKPCVMDIKMGRRQYGYGASARGASPCCCAKSQSTTKGTLVPTWVGVKVNGYTP